LQNHWIESSISFMTEVPQEPKGTVRSLDEMAQKYGFGPPGEEEFVGPDSAKYVQDYGPPVETSHSGLTYERQRARHPEIYGRPSIFERLGDRFFGDGEVRQQAEREQAEENARWASLLDRMTKS
jgi:hypothetical protein